MAEMDEIDEELKKAVRVATTSAARIGQTLMRVREEQQRRARETSEQARRTAEERMRAEQSLARLSYRQVNDPAWWQRATPEDIAEAYRTAVSWSGRDEHADRARQQIEGEVQDRYGVELDPSQVATVGPALQQAQERLSHAPEHEEHQATRELAAAEAADQGHDATRQESPGDSASAGHEWDSSMRRDATARQLRDQGVPAEAVDARMRADLSQAQPMTHAARQSDRGPQAHHRAGPALDREQDPGRDR